MLQQAGSIAVKYALPAAILLICLFILRLLMGIYYQPTAWHMMANLALDVSIITIFSYRCIRNYFLDQSEANLIPSTHLSFTIFNITSIFSGLIYITFAAIFYYLLDPGSFLPAKVSMQKMSNIEFTPAQFLLLLFLMIMNFSVFWSLIYFGMKRYFH